MLIISYLKREQQQQQQLSTT